MWKTGGKRTVADKAIPQQLTSDSILAYAVRIEVIPSNTKRIALGSDSTVRAGVAGSSDPSGNVLAILGKPADASSTPPSIERQIDNAPGGILLSSIYVAPEVDGEGVYWSYDEA